MKYKFENKFEPRYHEEAGHWYAEMFISPRLPINDKQEFETEEECRGRCNELNKADDVP